MNRSGRAIDQVDVGRMTVCPKHHIQLTTLYKAKVMDRDFFKGLIVARVFFLSGITTYHRIPTFLGRLFEGSVHGKTAYNPGLQLCYFPSRDDCSLSRKLRLAVIDLA